MRFCQKIFIVILCLIPVKGLAAITAIAGAHACAQSTGDSATTAQIDTTGANFIAIHTAYYDGANRPVVTDNKSNGNATILTHSFDGAWGGGVLHYYVVPTVGSGHTFTATLTGGLPALCVQAFAGVSTSSPFDQQNGAVCAGCASTTSGSITPSEDNELIISGVSDIPSGTINSGFTTADQITGTMSVVYGVAISYKIQGAAASVNPTWTLDSGTDGIAHRIASFKAAAVSTTCTSGLTLLGVGVC